MPKCAGSSIRWSLHAADTNRKVGVYWDFVHAPLNAAPTLYKDWPAVGFIRNPLTWYGSWYAQKIKGYRKSEQNAPLSTTLSNKFQWSFDTFLYNATHLQEFFSQEEHIEALRQRVHINLAWNSTTWVNLFWQNLRQITIKDFESRNINTLFDWWFTQIGMGLANEVYRIEDGVQNGFDTAFPNNGIKLQHLNKQDEQQRRRLVLSSDQKKMVRIADQQYTEQFNY